MKKLWILLFCLIPFICHATMMTDFTEETSPASTDIVWITKTPATTPLDRKVSLANLFGIGLGLNNTWTGSNTFTGAVDLQSTFTFGSGTGIVYNTGGTVSTETSLPSTVFGGFTASRGACSDGSGNLTTCTTQPMVGSIPIITKADSYTLGTDDAREPYGYMVFMSGDSKILTLPAVAAGMSVCVYSTDATAKVVDPNGSDGIRNGTAARNADGHKITSDASAGAFVCLIGDSADGWTVLGKSGTWTDE